MATQKQWDSLTPHIKKLSPDMRATYHEIINEDAGVSDDELYEMARFELGLTKASRVKKVSAKASKAPAAAKSKDSAVKKFVAILDKMRAPKNRVILSKLIKS